MLHESSQFQTDGRILDVCFQVLYEILALVEGLLHHLFKEVLQLLPLLGSHTDNSACSQALAIAQSRLTVRELILRYSPISSSDMPPK